MKDELEPGLGLLVVSHSRLECDMALLTRRPPNFLKMDFSLEPELEDAG